MLIYKDRLLRRHRLQSLVRETLSAPFDASLYFPNFFLDFEISTFTYKRVAFLEVPVAFSWCQHKHEMYASLYSVS